MSVDLVIDAEIEQLLEDNPIGLILKDEETSMLKERKMEAETEPPTNERGGATQTVAPQRTQVQADGEGGKEGGHNDEHPCSLLPMLPTVLPLLLVCRLSPTCFYTFSTVYLSLFRILARSSAFKILCFDTMQARNSAQYVSSSRDCHDAKKG